jgi:endonuclease/exonuclease/phosphatase family metal-dependent hydrolase
VVKLIILLSALIGSWGDGNMAFADTNKGLTVMTQNLYDGTDRTGLLEATTLPEFVAAVDFAYSNMLNTKPKDRLALIAQEIAANKADVVGLQEASIWRTGPSSLTNGSVTPAETVQFDFLQILLDELKKLNQSYFVAAVLPGLDVQLPGSLQDVRLTDRDVIIYRRDLLDRGIQVTNLQEQDYLSQASYPVAALNVQVTERSGWASIDLVKGKLTTRIAATHLNFNPNFDPTIATAQAKELLATAGNSSSSRTVLLGDFNSSADNPLDPTFATYQTILNGGYQDAWLVNGNAAGLTCCQDENLTNLVSKLSVRYDLILTKGVPVLSAQVVGDQQVSGLWPSDHAGVIATLQ